MAPPGTSWHYETEPENPNSATISASYEVSGTASEAGGRAFAAKRSSANRARATIIFTVQRWNVMFRLYGPLEPWFDKTWWPGEPELVR